MTLSIEELEQARKAWENIQKQSRIDGDQAEMYLQVVVKRINDLKDVTNN